LLVNDEEHVAPHEIPDGDEVIVPLPVTEVERKDVVLGTVGTVAPTERGKIAQLGNLLNPLFITVDQFDAPVSRAYPADAPGAPSSTA
jgi:hypothetical protein